MLTRREMLHSLGLATAGCALPNLSFAATDSTRRFVLIILRGAVDGLALVAPYADSNYERVRGELAIAAPGEDGGLRKLDGFFGLHPAMNAVHRMYEDNDAAMLHSVASPYRERSHFDGQDLLENGGIRVGRMRDGWLNRALAPLGGSLGSERAIALAQNTPLVLRGEQSSTSWAPSQLPDADDTTIERLRDLYAGDEFFAIRLEQALRSQDIAGGLRSTKQRGNESRQFAELMTSAASFLTAPDGPTIAVAEFGGWDTHANQGASTGALANRLAALDTGLANLKKGLADGWASTVVAVVTEFGRTVRVNGTRGTDHGTGTAALLLGGAVAGGKVIADWPGLREAELYAGRDLMPTLDLRSVFKTVLVEHLAIDHAFVDSTVFPDSQIAKPVNGLIVT